MATDTNNLTAPRLALAGAALAAVLGAAAGCQNDNGNADIHGTSFPKDGEPRAIDRFVQAQSAAAARADATLSNAHFDHDGGLNSLGRAKLDHMLRDDEASWPLVVYLDVRDPGAGGAGIARGPAADRCEDASRRYLADRGLKDAAVEFRSGPNLGYTHPARDGVRGLARLNGDDAAGGEKPELALPLIDTTSFGGMPGK